MLYHLLYPYYTVYSWLNLFQYITFRAMLAFVLSFALTSVGLPLYIKWIRRRGLKGQPIRDDGPAKHAEKQGTPTMGGIVVVGAVSLATLLFCRLDVSWVWTTLFVLVSYAILGFFDDWRKITQQNTRGVPGKVKLFWQFGVALVAAGVLAWSGLSSDLSFPFFKNLQFELGWFFLPFAALVIVGTSNAVNLTDGLDGLAVGPIMTVAATYAIFAYVVGRSDYSSYLEVISVSSAGELAVLLSAIVAGGLGFLWHNTYPADVFMGDIGALSLGGALGTVAVVVKHEIVLVVAGGIFVVEALSVLIQVYSFKLTGKRVFRMAPIHHHFELKGWVEPKIIVRFWIISILLAALSLTTLKVR